MPQAEPIVSADWVGQLSHCLHDLVDYERSLERELVRLRRGAEVALGVPRPVTSSWPEILWSGPAGDSPRRLASDRHRPAESSQYRTCTPTTSDPGQITTTCYRSFYCSTTAGNVNTW